MFVRSVLALGLVVVTAGCGSGDNSTIQSSGTAESSGAPSDSSSTEPPISVSAAATKWCPKAAAVNQAATEVGLTQTPEATEVAYQKLLDAVHEAAPEAPPEIASDVAEFVGAVESYYETLAAAGFDKESPEVTGLTDVMATISTTSTNIDKYNIATCGLE